MTSVNNLTLLLSEALQQMHNSKHNRCLNRVVKSRAKEIFFNGRTPQNAGRAEQKYEEDERRMKPGQTPKPGKQGKDGQQMSQSWRRWRSTGIH